MTTAATQRIFPAIDAGDLESVRKLLDEDPGLAHVQHMDATKHQFSPLQLAASLGHLDICRLLVDRGAEVYTNPMNTYPPVIQAAWKKHDAVVRYFLDEIPDKAHGTNGLGVTINLAAREGWADIVAEHIRRDPLAVHQRGWIGDTALHWPSHNNHAHIVAMLLDAGAVIDPDECNWIGGKPLHWASEHAPDSVRVLLGRGANVNSRNTRPGSKFFQMTPLMWNATQKDDCSEITEILIEAGAEINAVDAAGKTALDHAREHKLPRIEGTLRAHGAR
jgi:ankyrin repeat protein